MVAPEFDTGPCVEALLKASPGQNLIAHREWMDIPSFVKAFNEILSVDAKFKVVPDNEFMLPELAEEFSDMAAYCTEFGYAGEKASRSQVTDPEDVCAPLPSPVFDHFG